MHPWAVDGVIPFNLLMACVDAAGLYYVYRSRTAAAWWKAGIFATAASFLLVSLFTFGPWFLFRMYPAGYRHFAVIRLVTYVIFLHGTICTVGGAWLLRKAATKTAVLSALATLGLILMAIDAFWIEPFWLEVTHLRIESAKLDRPLRVAVVADYQAEEAGAYERSVLERLRAERPDLILLAGDYLHPEPERAREAFAQTSALFKEIGLDAPEGVFAVEGNVDRMCPWRSLFAGLPVVALGPTHTFTVGPLDLTCLSMRDSFNHDLRIARKNPDRFHLVLGHSPDFARGKIDADLLVAGHTHGGQVRLPWIGALSSGCTVPRAWAAGVTKLPSGAKLLVSRGIGMERGDAPRLRFLCRPQLILIDLVPKER